MNTGVPLLVFTLQFECLKFAVVGGCMRTHILKFILTIGLAILAGLASADAATVTGEKCKLHLEPVTLLLNSDYLPLYYPINNEITNVLGQPLNKIATVKSETPLVQNFVAATQRTIKQCHARCGDLFACKDLGKQNILWLNRKIDEIDESKTSQVADVDPFGSEVENAVVAIEEGTTAAEVVKVNSEDGEKPIAQNAKDSEIEELACIYDANCFEGSVDVEISTDETLEDQGPVNAEAEEPYSDENTFIY